MPGTRFTLEVCPEIPERLGQLPELAEDLLYSWNWTIRSLFRRLDGQLWESCGHDPKLLVRRVSQDRLDEAARDPEFLEVYDRAVEARRAYHDTEVPAEGREGLDPAQDLVAYFCMEYGLHESLKLYSGGLGILAGDHCKAASDLDLPFVAVGLLYHEGYFDQSIDAQGNQQHVHTVAEFHQLPVTPAVDPDGNEVSVEVDLPGRSIRLRVWRLRAGRVDLYLLDSDVADNSEEDRHITYRLYGGDEEMRIRQEAVLGVGGVRALRALGLRPSAWHINEGHSAFQVLERCREHVAQGRDFDAALELVACRTLFTTHTPVAAGHDFFPESQIRPYMEVWAKGLKVPVDRLLELGRNAARGPGLNMTALALRGSRFHNGVSRIHGRTASHMETGIWPEVPAEDNPIDHITNGVHLPTFIAPEWVSLLDAHVGNAWRLRKTDPDAWEPVHAIPDDEFWDVRRALKTRMLETVRRLALRRYERLGLSPTEIDRLLQWIDPGQPERLTVGFARRFTAYKRAALLFDDLPRLQRIACDPERPVVFLFAGKAHPRDENGQRILRQVHRLSRSRELAGHVVLLEGYDLALARDLLAGVDVWLNTPEYPLEASGTSGQKAGLNGVLNLSVLDGWWPEGFTGDNGWALAPRDSQTDPAQRRAEESMELLDILEEQVVPLYYGDREAGHPSSWVRAAKRAMATLAPRFNAERMVREYARRYYAPASRRGRALEADELAGAAALAAWKARVRRMWPGVHLQLAEQAPERIDLGAEAGIEVVAHLAGLNPDDVVVECVLEHADGSEERLRLEPGEIRESGEAPYRLQLSPEAAGPLRYRVRAFPWHPDLTHDFELGCMRWLE